MGARIPMPTETASLLTLTQWLSPAYPVGAFSYSHGLETAIQLGHVFDCDTFRCWLTDILAHGAGRNDAILLASAYGARSSQEITDIDALARALSPSRERLMETTLQGTAFSDLTSEIWPAPIDRMCYPVAIGAAAKTQSIPLEQTLAMYLHAFAANLTSAAIRLVPLGQSEGQAALASVSHRCETLAQEALTLSLDDLGGCSFAADIASMKHETQYSRIFRS